MEGLDELDRLEAVAAVSGGESPGGGELVRTPRGKSARFRNSRDFALPSAASDGAPDDSAVGADVKQCIGCQRVWGTKTSLLVQGDIVEWAYTHGRGGWCSLCYNCWRSCLKSSVSLVFLAHQITTDGSKMLDWTQTLIAYAMLKREGLERITAQQVADRRQSIQWLLRAMGLPVEPSVVVPWVALTAEERESADPLLLTSVHMGAGDYCLGLFVPTTTRINPPRLSRPVPGEEGDCVFHTFNTLLSSASESEHAELGVALRVPEGRTMLPIADAPGTQEEFSVLGVRLNNAVSACKLLLINFCSDTWADAVKESSFTAPVGKLGMIADEAEHTLQARVAGKAVAWKSLMLEAKTFIRKFREYRKRWAHERLIDLHPCLPKFVSEWTTLMGDELAASLRVLRLKLEFYTQAAGSGEKCSIKAALGDLMAQDIKSFFPHRVLGGGEGEVVDLDVWLRGPLFHAMHLQVGAMTLDTAQESVKTFHADLQDTSELLGKLELHELRSDLEAVLGVIAPFLQIHVPAQQVRSALKQLHESRNNKALQLFDQVVGELVKGAADMVVQRSVKDTAGDERFAAANIAINSEHLPRWVQDGGGVTKLKNWGSVCSGMVFEALQEAAGNVMEALSVWSSIHAEELGANLSQWADAVLVIVRATDAAITVYWSQNMQEGIEALNEICETVDNTPSVNFVWDNEVKNCLATMGDQPVAAEAFERVERCLTNGFKGLLRSCRSLKGKLVERFPRVPSWDALEAGVQAALKNQDVRQSLVNVFVMTANLGRFARLGPGLPLVQDWLAQRNTGGGQAPHLLDTLSEIATIIKSLGGCDPVLSFHMQDFSTETRYASDTTMLPWQGSDGSEVATALVRGAYGRKVQEALKEEVAQVLAHLTDALCFQAISPMPAQDSMDDDETSVADRVLGIIRFGDNVDAVARQVASTLDDPEVALPVNSLLEVLCKLVTTVGLHTLPLGHLVARPNAPPTEAPTDMVLHAVVKYDRVSTIAHYLVYLAILMTKRASQQIGKEDHNMHPHIPKAIRKVHDLLKAPEDDGNAELEDAFRNFSKPWAMSAAEVSAFHRTAKSWWVDLATTFFADATAKLDECAAHLTTCTPKYTSFLNDQQYHKALATKQLMNWPHRQELPTMTMKLFTAAASLKNLRNEWTGLGLELPSIEEPSAKVVVVLQEAKKAVATMAGVEAVQCLQGPKQVEAATKVLAKDGLLPLALRDSLRKVCAGSTVAAATPTPAKGTKRKALTT